MLTCLGKTLINIISFNSHKFHFTLCLYTAVADSGGRRRREPPTGPIVSFSHTFLPKSAPNGSALPPNRKSWIRSCFHWRIYKQNFLRPPPPPTGPNFFVFAYIFTEKHSRRWSTPQTDPRPLREILDPPLL